MPTETKVVKAGWKTTEFWLTLAASTLGLLFASGVLGEGTTWDKIAGIAATALSTLGYQVNRMIVKK